MIDKFRLFIKGITVVFLLSTSVIANAAAIKITGKVSDDKNIPLIGATIVVEGTNVGAVTALDGTYTITVPSEDSNLVFGYMGYESQTMKVGAKSVINITMQSDLMNLDDVVVVGYGVQRKRDVTGAITTVSKQEIEERQPISVFDAIQGASPGVLVVSDSSAPGSSSTVTIRGTSTIEGGTSPLYIVDGVPQDDIDNINPSDIRSIEILKDAASAAIYGSRSANGVIIITTESGGVGDPSMELRYLHGFSMMAHTLDQANSDDARAHNASYGEDSGISFIPDATDPYAYNRTGNADYQDLLSQVANRDQVDFSVKGATDKFAYMASVGFLNETGIIINSDNQRLTSRVNTTYHASDKVSLISRMSLSYQDQNAISASSTFWQAFRRPSYYILEYPDGSYMYDNNNMMNPVAYTEERTNNTKNYNITFYQGIDIKLADGLKLNANANGSLKLTRLSQMVPASLKTSDPALATLRDQANISRMLMAEAYLSYDKTIAKDHKINFVAGVSVQDWLTEEFEFYGEDLVTESIFTSNTIGSLDLATSGSTATSNALVGMFARLGYSYKGRYLLNGTIRRDGSSRFVNNKWGTFPSLSVGWRISDESFMQWANPVLTDAKFRVSYGTTGNQQIGNYESTVAYDFGSYYYNGETGVATSTTLSNPNIKWETTSQLNYGVDLAFFKNRLSVSVDYYNKLTSDLLYSANVPSEIGYSTMKMNYGSIRNKGVEIMVSGYPIKNKDFTWQTTVSWARNQNTVEELAVDDYVASDAWMVAEGMPLGLFYGYNSMGVYAYDESNAYIIQEKNDGTIVYGERLIPVFERDQYGNVKIDSNGDPTKLLGYTHQDGSTYIGSKSAIGKMTSNGVALQGGDRIWQDIDHNGDIDDSDRKILGSGTPEWTGTWTNMIKYKRFTLSFTFYGSFGNEIYNYLRYSNASYSASTVTPDAEIIYNAWKFPGQETSWPIAASRTADNSARGLIDDYLEDGSYIRLRNLRVSYTLNPKITKKFGVEGLMLYAYGTNLFTLTSYSGYDPEFSSGTLTPGYDNGRYPKNREFGVGANFKF